jgi:hypothetical protein
MTMSILVESFIGRRDEDVIWKKISLRRGDFERICILSPIAIEGFLFMLFTLKAINIINSIFRDILLIIMILYFIVSIIFMVIYYNFIKNDNLLCKNEFNVDQKKLIKCKLLIKKLETEGELNLE